MNNTTITPISFSDLLGKNKWQVPEIQREYVWGNNESLLEHFFNDISKNNAHNIGFLYSYTPSHAQDQKNSIVYLIDGQQRFTTLYLALFYFSIVEGKKEFSHNDKFSYEVCTSTGKFTKQFTKKEYAAQFSYRVRTSTEEFIQRLIENVSDFGKIKEQTWFLSHYKKDPSITGILNLLQWLRNYKSPPEMVDKILKTEFWNFNIDQAGQGEELYIKMNSRGEQLSANENIRPYLLETVKDKQKAGKEFDNWQEFFWKYRGSNPNADKGLNAFLSWVIILEFHKNSPQDLKYSEINSTCSEKNLLNEAQEIKLTVEKIIPYFTALENITSALKGEIFNTIAPKLINEDGKNNFENNLAGEIGERGKMFLLPLLAYYSEHLQAKIDKHWVRFFYTIAFNQKSQAFKYVLTIASKNCKDPIDLLQSPKLLEKEEKIKLECLRDHAENRDKLEEIFQNLEDHWLTQVTIEEFISKSINEKKISLERLQKYENILISVTDRNLFRRELLA
ncbi:MAG: DUF262 domain-containing protein, partial [Treponemataceae bacterium]